MATAPAKSLGQRLMEWGPLVSIYESRFWRRSGLFARIAGIPFDQEIASLSHEARLEEARRVLDLACGSGIYTRPFAHRLSEGRVVGLDLSVPMLAQARRTMRAEGLANLDLVRGSALDLPFDSGCFDVVNCCGAVHLFPDIPRALAEIQRVLAPGGRFTSAVFRRGPSDRDARRAERRERMMGVHAFTRDEYEARLAQAGFVAARFPHEHEVWMLAAAEKPAA